MKLTLHPPFHLLQSIEVCWKCGQPSKAIAFATTAVTPHDEEEEVDDFSPLILKDIEAAPIPFVKAAAQVGVDFRKRVSRTTGRDCFMNHCGCGAPFGDFYLHSEPGHAYFPLDVRDAELITIRRIDWDEDLEADCGFAGSTALFIFEHGTPDDPIEIPGQLRS